MNSAPNLHELQLWVRWLVTDPRGVHEALNEPPSWLLGDEERLDVYAEGYFLRILESAGKSFSLTLKVLGTDLFAKLIVDYLKIYPSKYTSIDEVGRHLPDFISTHEMVTDSHPWAVDIAKFEWIQLESFYSKEAEGINPKWLEEMNGVNPSEVRFRIHSSLRFMESNWPLAEILRSLDGEKPPQEFKPKKSFFAIYRSEDSVVWEQLDPVFFGVLKSLNMGRTLDESLSFVDEKEMETLDGNAVSENFSHWVRSGILCGLVK